MHRTAWNIADRFAERGLSRNAFKNTIHSLKNRLCQDLIGFGGHERRENCLHSCLGPFDDPCS